MDGVHELAAQIFIRLIVARTERTPASAEDATDAAREAYIYAKAFFEQHGRHQRGA